MKLLKTEKNILNIIKYGPILFVILLSVMITQTLISQKERALKQELKVFREDYINSEKQKVKQDVNKVYNIIKNEKEASVNRLKEQIKQRVYEAHTMATTIYEQTINKYSKQEIFELIKQSLGSLQFNNGRGYFFIDDKNGVKRLQPYNKQYEGKSLLNFEDAKGYKFVRKIVKTIENKTEAYDSYYWYKPNDKSKAYKKISFYKYFEPYDVVIGTGEYIDDFENELKEKLLKKLNKTDYLSDENIFIYNDSGVCLVYPFKEYVGVNRIDVKNSKGRYIVQDVINFAKEKNEGFMRYISSINPKKVDLEQNYKVSYVRYFEDWNWLIGNGIYLQGLEKEIEQKVQSLKESNQKTLENVVLISFIVTFIFIFISFYISKLIERKFLKYQEDLEEEAKRAIEKEKLLVQQSKMATMGEMIGSIAHQWKQPLSLISTSNGMLRLNLEFDSFPKKDLEESCENIDKSVQNLSHTIDDFRNFFNPNKKREYFKIYSALKKTFQLIKSQFKNNSIELIENVDNDVEIYAVENELLQTLINLFKNSKDEFERNTELEDKIVKISVYNKSQNAIIEVIDSAGGIPEDIISEIFEPYFTTKESKGGSGIGLYMCRQIVENMNGKISVENKEFTHNDKVYIGANFKIEIPNSY